MLPRIHKSRLFIAITPDRKGQCIALFVTSCVIANMVTRKAEDIGEDRYFVDKAGEKVFKYCSSSRERCHGSTKRTDGQLLSYHTALLVLHVRMLEFRTCRTRLKHIAHE